VSQCDDQTLRSIAETLVIHFDQEKFDQLLSGGSTSPLHVRKRRKVSVVRAPLAISEKLVFVETTKVLYESNTASREAKQAPYEPKQAPYKLKQALCETITVSTETKLAPRQRVNVAREAIKIP